MDLGTKIPESGALAEPAKSDKKFRYPDFTIRDEAAKKFIEEHDLDLGDYVTATVKLCVNGLRKDEYGNSISFDVESIDNVVDTDSDADSEEKPDEEEKILGYKRTPSAAKETPDLSAKDLE